MPLSAAEVLAGGLAVKNAADVASVWGKPAATLKPPVKASPPPSKPRRAPTDSSTLDSDPTASAASALLGLQKEPVSIAVAVAVALPNAIACLRLAAAMLRNDVATWTRGSDSSSASVIIGTSRRSVLTLDIVATLWHWVSMVC